MARTKPKSYPEWLFDPSMAFPGRAMCLWLCSGCGAPEFYAQVDGKHGRPDDAINGQPHLAARVGPCWRSKEYGVKCVTPQGERFIYHEGKLPTPQPEQTDAVWMMDNTDQKEGQHEW